MKKLILLIYGILITGLAFGQVRFEAKLDSSHILIGDQTKLHLKITQNPNWKIVFPTSIELGDSVEILDESLFDTLSTTPKLVIQKDLTITSFDSGLIRVPPIAVQYITPDDGTLKTTYSRPVFLNVAMVALSDSSKIKPIKAILGEDATWEDYIPYLITVAAIGLIIFLIWFLINRGSKQEDAPLPPPIIRLPHEVALENLVNLKQKELWQKGDIKAYQSQLTDIVRTYIEGRYKIPARESTTFEILHFLKDKGISTNLKTKIREMLEVADLVKFAKASPPVNINEKLMEDAVDFVQTTKYVPKIEEGFEKLKSNKT
ncbi:MAG: hypothetical protein ACPG19_06830 [Saprospiraceae bacterium]